jgi:hypothetical protein
MARIGPWYVKWGRKEPPVDNNAILRELLQLRRDIMTLDQSTKDRLEALGNHIDSLKSQIETGVAGIRTDIQNLKDAVGGGATPDEVNAALDDINTKLDTLGAAAQSVTDLDAENT